MSKLLLETLDGRSAFEPGDVVEGLAGWERAAPPRSAQVRLFWHTRGAGDPDVGVVDKADLDVADPVSAQPFRLRLPDRPYSYTGTLITICWAVELVLTPGKEVARVDLTVGGEGRGLRLER